MTEQLTILDLAHEPTTAQPTKSSTPRCRMCARPARWLAQQQEHAAYCAGRACSNRERICQQCDKPFTVRADGAGNKYCSVSCKEIGYHPATITAATCAWCPKPRPRDGQRRAGRWPYICQDCLDPIRHLIDRLKKHNVPHQRARQLLHQPGCEICGINLIERIRNTATGRLTSRLVVDHDHDCCPGEYSCGRCVRGLLCNRCNTAAGMLCDQSQVAQALAAYLDRWFSR
ncbi:endonuclease domain-containing protein [Micromonospora matsumotoense]|uniref:endonuclease domain-containing protein n=1 Tax=Micromonospora matsumotoense TaxID=121616 RepID=UPI003448715E